MRITLLLLTLGLFTGCNTQVVPTSIDGNFNTGWEFIKDPVDSVNVDMFLTNKNQLAGWHKIILPHTIHIEDVDSPEKQWQGIAWYRKYFTFPRNFKGKSVSLQFGAAMQVAKVYINGKLIQTHLGGYLPFIVKLDERINYGKQNCILVELDNRNNPLVPPGKPLAALDFNYYSGLYRNVTLRVKDKFHISDPIATNRIAGGGLLVTFADVSKSSAKVNIQVDLENENLSTKTASLRINLMDKGGKDVISENVSPENIPAQGFYRFKKQFVIQNPDLWSSESPNLYKLKIQVNDNHQPVDSISEVIGIRTFSFTAKDGFVLNGEKIRLRGTNRHQEYPFIGNALSDNAQYRDAYKIKQAGFNFVRCSHYPQSPAFLKACDELGIMVMDAIPGWQYCGNVEFQENSLRDVREMVRRDRNHPSIILWEASLNESGMPKQFIKRAHDAVHEELPVSDVFTCGWVDEIYDVFIPARQHSGPPDYWNKYDKNKPIIIAEYGDWEYYAQNAGFNQTAYSDLKQNERNSRQLRGFGQKRLAQQALNFQESHNNNLIGPAAGDANWLMFDYKRGYATDIESSGIMDIFRLPKFAFYLYQSQTESSGPVIYIANFWYTPSYREVKVYSNCEEVELSLSGKIIARQKADKDHYSANLKHPPFSFAMPEYVPGTLEAKGFINGKEVIKTERKTPGLPAKIVLSADLSGKELEAGKNDLVFVYASVCDENGTIIPEDSRAVSFTFEGDAELIGNNPRKAEAGISTILVRAGSIPGLIRINAIADSLTTGNIELKVIYHDK